MHPLIILIPALLFSLFLGFVIVATKHDQMIKDAFGKLADADCGDLPNLPPLMRNSHSAPVAEKGHADYGQQ